MAYVQTFVMGEDKKLRSVKTPRAARQGINRDLAAITFLVAGVAVVFGLAPAGWTLAVVVGVAALVKLVS
jgi:hypothetical protein